MSNEKNESERQDEAEKVTSPSSSQVVAGCRKSELALIQTRYVVSQLAKTLNPSPVFVIATASVTGDADKHTPFMLLSKQTGGSDVGKSLWTNGLEVDLVSGKVHFLVHSLKDMPTTLPPDCILGAIPEREDSSDAVIMRPDSEFKSIDQLPPGSVVGSSSSRRRALVRRNWPHLEVAECRGNVILEDTDSGHARIEYTIPIELQAGTNYAFRISLKNSRYDLGTDWTLLATDLLTPHLKKDGVSILETKPSNPEDLTHDWIQFTSLFATVQDQGGPVILSIEIKTTGVALEWYFDDIYIKKVDI
ncbi:hypothetical protein QQZ08_006639 [Neonectria magnoliae]|uniref:hydroxymethylbilane synthase n=1 Tax=Neonectria magnoliae TaxID=2732573 RepID=A0ABR1I024_9HYPO